MVSVPLAATFEQAVSNVYARRGSLLPVTGTEGGNGDGKLLFLRTVFPGQ